MSPSIYVAATCQVLCILLCCLTCTGPCGNGSSQTGDTDSSSLDGPWPSSSDSKTSKMSDGKSSNDTSHQFFQCRCGSNCNLDTYVSGKCLGSLKAIFPHLDVNHLSESDKDKLIRKLTREVRRVIDIFEDLVCDTFKSLKEEKTPIDELRAVVLTFGQQGLPKPYCEAHKDKLSTITSIFDIQSFLVEHKYISFFNYRILQKIIKRFGTNADKIKLENYLTEFGIFCKRSVFEVPSRVIANLSPALEGVTLVLVVKVNEKIWFEKKSKATESSFTLDDLYMIEDDIAEIIGLDTMNILLRDVRKGCVELSLLMLAISTPFVLPPSKVDELLNLGIDYIFQTHEVSTPWPPTTVTASPALPQTTHDVS